MPETFGDVPRWLLWLIGTLIVGALGSGLWEGVFKPSGNRLARWTMNFRAARAKHFKDNTYKRIATSLPQRTSLYNFHFSHSAIAAGAVVVPFFMWTTLWTIYDIKAQIEI